MVTMPSVAATPVQAATADPVKALKSKFVAGKGVKFTDVATLVEFTGNTTFLKRTGSFQFGRAADRRLRMSPRTINDDGASKYPGFSGGVRTSPERTFQDRHHQLLLRRSLGAAEGQDLGQAPARHERR